MTTETITLPYGGYATRWNSHGDYDRVGKPLNSGYWKKCAECGMVSAKHGILFAREPTKICPGDWIVEFPHRDELLRLDDLTFRAIYTRRESAGLRDVAYTRDNQTEPVPEQAEPAPMVAPDPNENEGLRRAIEDMHRHGIGVMIGGRHVPHVKVEAKRQWPDETKAQATEHDPSTTYPPGAGMVGPAGSSPLHPDYTKSLPEPKNIRDAIRQRDGWVEAAAYHEKNERFYRDLVIEIGEMFGESAKTSDDGSIGQDVLALKVPELVRMELNVLEANQAEIDRLNAEVVRLTADFDIWHSHALRNSEEISRYSHRMAELERALRSSEADATRLTVQRDTWHSKAEAMIRESNDWRAKAQTVSGSGSEVLRVLDRELSRLAAIARGEDEPS